MIKVAFDCDGTLIDFERKPQHSVIQLFNLLESFGCVMHIWSGGGLGYAQNVANILGLKAKIIQKTKSAEDMDLVVDDETVNLGKVNLRVPLKLMMLEKLKREVTIAEGDIYG